MQRVRVICSLDYFTMFNMLTPFLTLNSLESKNTGSENIQTESISEKQSENLVDSAEFVTHDLTEDADIIAEMQGVSADVTEIPTSDAKTNDDAEVIELTDEVVENKTNTENQESENIEQIDDKESKTDDITIGDTYSDYVTATGDKTNDSVDAVVINDDSEAADTSQDSVQEVTDKAASDKPTSDNNTIVEASGEEPKQENKASVPESEEKMETDAATTEQEKAAGDEAATGETAAAAVEGDSETVEQPDQKEQEKQPQQEEGSKGDVEQADPSKVGETKRLVTISHSLAVSCSSWRIGCVFLPAFWACR